MKLIGKNSASTLLKYFFLIVLIGTSSFLFYLDFGGVILWFNKIFNLNLLSNIYSLENTLNGDYLNCLWITKSNRLHLEYNLNYFAEFNLIGIYYILYFIILFRIFDLFSSNKIFSSTILIWLKRFAFLNLLFIPINALSLYLTHVNNNLLHHDLGPIDFTHILISIVVVFMLAFFKKGYELQSEIDLTI